MSSTNVLDPSSIRAWFPGEGAQPRIEIEGKQTILNARVRRAFPLTEPSNYLSVQDGAGKEVGMLASLDGLQAETRKVIEQELDRRYFAPVISKINSLKQEAGMWQFVVETQRGPSEFYVRNWRDSAHEVGGGQWQIQSVDGQRYFIRKMDELDERSQSLLDEIF